MDSKTHRLDIWVDAECLFQKSWVAQSAYDTILASSDFKMKQSYSKCYFAAPYVTDFQNSKPAKVVRLYERTKARFRMQYRAYGKKDDLYALVCSLEQYAPRPSDAANEMALQREEFHNRLDKTEIILTSRPIHFKRIG